MFTRVTREYAIERMRRVLYEFKITGIKNNIKYLRNIMSTPDFVEGHYDTGFIAKHGEELTKKDPESGTKQNIARMVHNNYTQKRYSMLKQFLINEQEKYKLLFEN